MDWCEHNDDPAMCPPCRRATGKDPSLARRLPTVRRRDAEHPGQCGGCNLPIYPGQPIAKVPDRPWTHAGCVDETENRQ